jgi:hypothetical protein
MSKENFSIINYTDSEIPKFEEKQGKKYVTYGADDLYGEYLRDLFLASSTNGAIINGVADMIYGGGLNATDREENDQKKAQWLRLQDLLRKSDDDLLKMVAFDLKLYGMSYLNVIWNKARTQIAMIKHLPVHTIRSGVADSDGRSQHSTTTIEQARRLASKLKGTHLHITIILFQTMRERLTISS